MSFRADRAKNRVADHAKNRYLFGRRGWTRDPIPRTASTNIFHEQLPRTASTNSFHEQLPRTDSTNRFHEHDFRAPYILFSQLRRTSEFHDGRTRRGRRCRDGGRGRGGRVRRPGGAASRSGQLCVRCGPRATRGWRVRAARASFGCPGWARFASAGRGRAWAGSRAGYRAAFACALHVGLPGLLCGTLRRFPALSGLLPGPAVHFPRPWAVRGLFTRPGLAPGLRLHVPCMCELVPDACAGCRAGILPCA